jgi:cytochrome c oxidase subunit 2
MGQCAEFCGSSHSLMGVRVIAESPEEFEAWLEDWRTSAPPEEPAPTADELPEGLDPILVEQGREIFHSQTCVACHSIRGTNAQGQIAPDLTLLGRRTTIAAGWLDNTVEDLERWIRAPREVKPGVLMPGVDEAGGNWPATGLTDQQVRAVAQYLHSLR